MDMNFGFSYVGLIFLLMLLTPNFIWIKNKPKDYDKYVINENKILIVFERIGEVLVVCISLCFSDFNINTISSRTVILVIAFAVMILYEISWMRYFKIKKEISDFYKSILLKLHKKIRKQKWGTIRINLLSLYCSIFLICILMD